MKIRSFSDFITEDVKEVSFAFGRFNPPSAGHEKLFDALKKNSNGSFRIYASQSQDPKKNPLSHKDKIKFMRKMFPKYARNIVADKDAKNALEVLTKLYDQGFTKVNMVVGSDRLKEFDRLLNRYNGEKSRHGFYQFEDGINVISAGERDPDAEGVEGMSASKLRKAAQEGNIADFTKGMPSGFKDISQLYNAVRKGMGLKESYERPHIKLETVSSVREDYVEGKIFNEGDKVIVKESRETAIIAMTGSNYLMLEFANGERKRAWLDSVELKEPDLEEDAWASDWLGDKTARMIDRLTHPKKYKRAIRFYLDLRRKSSGSKDNASITMKKAAKVTNVDYKNLSKIFHDLIKKGDLPKHLAFESNINNSEDDIQEDSQIEESSKEALKNKAEKSGISYSILKKVFDRGEAAWHSGHRPGTNATQWGLARVNSFIAKKSGTWGGADKDLADKVRSSKKEDVNLDENLRKQIAQLSKEFPEGSKVRMKHNNKIATVLSVGKDYVKVAIANKTMEHKPEELIKL